MASRAPRRSSSEVRSTILATASAQFAADGYAATTMRSIGAGAGISQSVIHRHFPTKEALFSAALLAPFLAAFEHFSEQWRSQLDDRWADERIVVEFTGDLHEHLKRNRATLVALVAASDAPGTDLLAEIRESMTEILGTMQMISEQQTDVVPVEVIPHTNRITLSLVTGLVLLEPWFSDGGDDEEALLETMVRMLLYGIRLTPPDAEAR